MTEFDESEQQIAHLRDLVGLADLDTMETKELLKHQTKLMNALRENQNSMTKVLAEQGSALGGMVLSINGLQQRVSSVDKRVVNVEHKITSIDGRVSRIEERVVGLDGRLTGVEERLTGVEGRLTGVEERLTGVEQHLTGVEDKVSAIDGRLTRVEDKVTGIDQNVVAIMRHLGV